jgi:hypothetical protein
MAALCTAVYLDIFRLDSNHCGGNSGCRMSWFAAVRASGAAQFAVDSSGRGRHRNFCHNRAGTGPVHHFVAGAGC